MDFEDWDIVGAREALLEKTLSYVTERVPYYQKLVADGKLSAPFTLSQFPLIDSTIMGQHLHDFLVLDRFPDQILVTGGTTAQPSLVVRTVDEYERMWERNHGFEPGDLFPLEQITSFKIFACDMTHGAYFDAPHGQPLVRLPFKKTLHARIIRRFIEEGLNVGGRQLPAAFLEMEFLDLKLLTAYLLSEGVDLPSSGIKRITSYGYHTPREWRQRLADAWGAEVKTFYGLSEFNLANMREVSEQAEFQIPMQVVPELWAPDRSGPLPDAETGEGVLVLTSLHPYIEVQPRIRYWTNDVVARTGFNEDIGEVCYRYRGRRNLCVMVEEEQSYRTILTATDVVDVVDEIEGVQRDDSYVEDFCGGFYGGGLSREEMVFATGIPQFDLEIREEGGRPSAVIVRVELADDPDETRSSKIAEGLREQLFEEMPTLCDDLYDNGIEFQVEALGPGGITAQGREVVVV